MICETRLLASVVALVLDDVDPDVMSVAPSDTDVRDTAVVPGETRVMVDRRPPLTVGLRALLALLSAGEVMLITAGLTPLVTVAVKRCAAVPVLLWIAFLSAVAKASILACELSPVAASTLVFISVVAPATTWLTRTGWGVVAVAMRMVPVAPCWV